MVKVLADAETDRLLGVHIVGAAGLGLIAEAVAGHGVQRQRRGHRPTCHAHPTLSEAVQEAALAVGQAGDPTCLTPTYPAAGS